MERSTQSSHWLAHWKSTCKVEIAMANVSNRTEGIKNIDKVTCKDDEVAETSSKGLKSIDVESMQNRNEFDIFNTWARGLCFDSRIQLQHTKDKIKSLSFIEDHRNVGQMLYTNLRHSECEDIHRNIHSSFEKNGETTKICTTVDSAVGLSGKHSRFSQTTQSLLIMKNSDCNLFKADRAHRNFRKGTDFGRYSLSKLNSVTPPISHVQHGVKPPSLHRFTDSELREKFKGIYYGLSKLASVEENNDEDANVFEDPMDIKVVHDNSEISVETEIMNLEAQTSSLDYKEPSFSRTQSLDKETVLSHVKPVNGSLKPDPGGKWLKRLRLNDSASYSTGTKRSDCMEKSHASKNRSKELMMVDEGTALKTHDSAKKDQDILLSKSWIRRWCPKKNINAEIGGENHSSKQFQSIAAMALMAKTMNCLEPCDVQNRGTFMVWSTKGYNDTV